MAQDTAQRRLTRSSLAEAFHEANAELVSDALRTARQRAGMTQEDVAAAIGVTRSRIAQIEGVDGAALTLKTLLKYSQAVGCRLDIDLVDPATEESVARVLFIDDDPEWVEATDSPVELYIKD